jgi:hypothetical protein
LDFKNFGIPDFSAQGDAHTREVKPKILVFSIAQTFRFGIIGITNVTMVGRLRPYCS